MSKADKEIKILPEQRAIDRIVNKVQTADPGSAPFALVVGSGFSHGLVPTAREIVEVSLPLWWHSLSEGVSFEKFDDLPRSEVEPIAKSYWREFVEQDDIENHGIRLSESGLPVSYGNAYRAAFTPGAWGGVGEPGDERKFLRALMRLERIRLNAAHFMLADILGAQPGRGGISDRFQSKAAFCRLILTTNFDPFLQIACSLSIVCIS